MKWLVSIAESIRRRVDRLRRRLTARVRRAAPRLRYERVDEFPDRLKPVTLYVAGEEPHVWAAAMLCPCGCGDVIELNLLEQASPCWSVRQHRDSTVSLTPSVWRTKGCRSHFILRNSRIEWCRSRDDYSSRRLRRR